jgi:hypothetical protein
MTQLGIPLLDFLHQALTSHRYALQLNPDSPDVLFNTAQVIITISEYVTEAGMLSAQADAPSLLQEALELLSACYTRQEQLVQEQNANSMDMEGGNEAITHQQQFAPAIPSSPTQPAHSNSQDQDKAESEYATIQPYITPSDLLDTARSSLTALTLLITLSDTNMSQYTKLGLTLTQDKIPHHLSLLDPEDRNQETPDISLQHAQWVSALTIADAKRGSVSLCSCLATLESVFSPLITDDATTTIVAALCAYADTLVDTTLLSSLSSSNHQQWTSLTRASDLYARACNVTSPDAVARKPHVYESRADTELLRFSLASSPSSSLAANVKNSAGVLVRNAGIYYRGAMNLFKAQGDMEASAKVEVRGLIAGVLEAKMAGAKVDAKIVEGLRVKGEFGRMVAVEMMREGLLAEDWEHGLM